MPDTRRTTKPKILVIVGPTASGKSDLAVSLARRFNGEVISADSRQVYRGMNIGSGKITKREMLGIPHHLLDVASPTARRVFTVADYQKLADAAIADILSRGKLPILCGGTGFYIDAVVSGAVLPDVPPNPRLRAQLEKKSPAQLMKILNKLDPRRAAEIDAQNPRRLVRAIEITKALGSVPAATHAPLKYKALFIGIDIEKDELKKRIAARLQSRLKKGMANEVRRLHERDGLSWKRMESFGLEYRYLAHFVRGKIFREEMIAELETAISQYARRQMSWFKRNEKIAWMKPAQKTEITKRVKNFLK